MFLVLVVDFEGNSAFVTISNKIFANFKVALLVFEKNFGTTAKLAVVLDKLTLGLVVKGLIVVIAQLGQLLEHAAYLTEINFCQLAGAMELAPLQRTKKSAVHQLILYVSVQIVVFRIWTL